jgi:hypothetical protein
MAPCSPTAISSCDYLRRLPTILTGLRRKPWERWQPICGGRFLTSCSATVSDTSAQRSDLCHLIPKHPNRSCDSWCKKPIQNRAEWLCLLEEYRERPLLDIKTEINQTEARWQERVAAGDAVVIKPFTPKQRRRAA